MPAFSLLRYRTAVPRRLVLTLLGSLLAACAAPSPTPVVVPLSYPPAARLRMVAIALAEWRDWGGVEVAGWDRLPSGPESDPANFPRVLAYWAAVPEGPAVIRRHRAVYAGLAAGAASSLWADPPWSAAFISYLARMAGVDAVEFPPAAAHSAYIDALLSQAQAYPELAPFQPHAPAERAAAPGDLLCADRAASPLPHWTARLPEAGRFRPMHCDLVVAVEPDCVLAIGGNVGDAVVRRRFPAAAGVIAPAPVGEAPFVVLLESRLGRSPPWSS